MAMRRMMKKSMKKMMRKKARKTMRKSKRVSKVAKGKRARMSVFNGRKQKTVGGLTKSHLKRNKGGKIVSIKHSNR